MTPPFVIAVASEKGGVGKTTIATNLAVYLKALREDLPVTIASFDNHFSVDQMFALGPRPTTDIAALFDGASIAELAVMGQYGVQYVASSRGLQAPSHAPGWLRQHLHKTDFPGILILDTRPILDWFTGAALLTADLVLVPVKDRAALVNAAALRQVLNSVECTDRLWLLPSLVDTRARLNAEVRVHEFLAYAARERDYQVLDFFISKSPKVESLASGFSSCIRPVLTHARNTAVHAQLKSLAEFVLAQCEKEISAEPHCPPGILPDVYAGLSAAHKRHIVLECPLCCRESLASAGHFFFDLRSRRRGFFHQNCFEEIANTLNLEDDSDEDDWFALTIDGPGLVGSECRLSVHCFDHDGQILDSEELELINRQPLSEMLPVITGRSLATAYRELILVSRVARRVEAQLDESGYRSFVARRRLLARTLRNTGIF